MDGLLLAGGKSRRMGAHKGELPLGKETFAEKLIKELKRMSETVYISYGEKVYREYWDCKVLKDETTGLGPIEGIIEGLRETKSDKLITIACDMPYMNAEFFRFMNEQFRETPDCLAVVPICMGKTHPLAAIYKKEALAFFEASVNTGDLSLKGALKGMPVKYVEVPQKYVTCLKNINTKEEYRCLQKEIDSDVQVEYDFAEKRLLDNTYSVKETEEVDLFKAVGRVLSEDIPAPFDNPPFNRSPLDGYALRSADISEASKAHPAVLKVAYEVTAGDKTQETVKEGEAVRIMTGAPIPQGADCIIRQEDTDFGEKKVSIYKSLKPYQNYCFKGEDFKEGDCLLKKGTRLNAASVGVLASTGRKQALVMRKVRAALITTGDEIRKGGSALREGQIYNSNLYTIAAVMEQQGFDVTIREAMGDNARDIADRIEKLVSNVDIVVTTGGVSVGKKDIMHDVFHLLNARRLFWRVKIKPGMPTLAGIYKDKPIVSLSGNPYGAYVNAILLLNPVHAKISGCNGFERIKVKATCMEDYPKKSGITRYLRASYKDEKVFPVKGSNDSGVLSTASYANALIEIPAGSKGLKKGDTVWTVLI